MYYFSGGGKKKRITHHIWHLQAQKLLLRDGTLANFTIQSPSTLPTITLGLPANARVSSARKQIILITSPIQEGHKCVGKYILCRYFFSTRLSLYFKYLETLAFCFYYTSSSLIVFKLWIILGQCYTFSKTVQKSSAIIKFVVCLLCYVLCLLFYFNCFVKR